MTTPSHSGFYIRISGYWFTSMHLLHSWAYAFLADWRNYAYTFSLCTIARFLKVSGLWLMAHCLASYISGCGTGSVQATNGTHVCATNPTSATPNNQVLQYTYTDAHPCTYKVEPTCAYIYMHIPTIIVDWELYSAIYNLMYSYTIVCSPTGSEPSSSSLASLLLVCLGCSQVVVRVLWSTKYVRPSLALRTSQPGGRSESYIVSLENMRKRAR